VVAKEAGERGRGSRRAQDQDVPTPVITDVCALKWVRPANAAGVRRIATALPGRAGADGLDMNNPRPSSASKVLGRPPSHLRHWTQHNFSPLATYFSRRDLQPMDRSRGGSSTRPKKRRRYPGARFSKMEKKRSRILATSVTNRRMRQGSLRQARGFPQVPRIRQGRGRSEAVGEHEPRNAQALKVSATVNRRARAPKARARISAALLSRKPTFYARRILLVQTLLWSGLSVRCASFSNAPVEWATTSPRWA